MLLDVPNNLKKYQEIFTKMVSGKGYWKYKNDAEERTDDFKYRHGHKPYRRDKVNKVLGAWRWKGLYQHRNRIVEILSGRGVDFGGGACPISKDAVIVDLLEKDIYGRKIDYKSLDDLDFEPDYIFSSHCLEHIQDIESVLKNTKDTLSSEGKYILHVPAYSCKRWLPKFHKNRNYGDHVWCFYIGDKPDGEYENLIAVDKLVEKYFDLSVCEYVGDNSIMIIGTPK